MKSINFKSRIHLTRKSGRAAALLLAVSALLFAGYGTTVSLSGQGYIFMHPFFKTRPWKASLDRLDLSLPASLDSVRPLSFDVSAGADSAVAVYSKGDRTLSLMPVQYQSLVAPCFDDALTFADPRQVALAGFTLPSSGRLYVVKDNVYRYDSILIAVPSAATPPRLLLATVKTAAAAVTRIDTVTFSALRSGQSVTGVAGTDGLGMRDTGLWVTGTNGLVRYVPIVNHRPGTVTNCDIPDAQATVSHADGSLAGTLSGTVFKRTAGTNTWTLAATTSPLRSVLRVYPQGVIGASGLWKETVSGVWRPDTTLGSGNYRWANFIRRPGGFGIELLDSTWNYQVFTYRDTSSKIDSATPDSVLKYINGTPCIYNSLTRPITVTLTLDDPDSNFSDYRLTLMPYGIDLKNDGKYAITKLSDSADCQIGALKMTSGRLQLTLSDTAVKVVHDCALGALDPTCLTCYWKKYDFAMSKRWTKGDQVNIQTGSQILRIQKGNGSVTASRMTMGGRDAVQVRISGNTPLFTIPLPAGKAVAAVFVYDLHGRLLASASVRGRLPILLPGLPRSGIVIVSCMLTDGSNISLTVPLVR